MEREVRVHKPVMLAEVLEGLGIRSTGRYLDGTLGGGGHARAMADQLDEEGLLCGIDRDPAAVERARERLEGVLPEVKLFHGNFAEMKNVMTSAGVSALDGILLDLGMSSFQIDEPERGFSFREEGPLDMRMDPGQTLTAANVVNGWSQ